MRAGTTYLRAVAVASAHVHVYGTITAQQFADVLAVLFDQPASIILHEITKRQEK